MKLYLVRHGESYSNTGGTVMSYTDMDLTEKGREQARRAGCALREALQNCGPLYAFCSNLCRTRQTGEAFCTGAAITLPLIACAALTEMHLGDMEGLTWPERDRRFPQISTHDGLSRAVIPGGESFQDVKSRCLRFAEEKLKMLEPDATVLIFSHGITLRVLVNTLLGRPDDDVNRLNWMENTAITEIDYNAARGVGKAIQINNYAHLQELGTADYDVWGVFCREPY